MPATGPVRKGASQAFAAKPVYPLYSFLITLQSASLSFFGMPLPPESGAVAALYQTVASFAEPHYRKIDG